MSGWWEEYRCGCVSETVARKKDLPGYCPKHGEGSRGAQREISQRIVDGFRTPDLECSECSGAGCVPVSDTPKAEREENERVLRAFIPLASDTPKAEEE